MFRKLTTTLYKNTSSVRSISSKSSLGGKGARNVALIVGGIGLSSGAYYAYNHSDLFKTQQILKESIVPLVKAASPPAAQPSVFSSTKEHALYLTIHLKPNADVRQCAKVVANLQNYVNQVCPADTRDEDDEVLAGVGLGPNFNAQVFGKTSKPYVHAHRKGSLGEMPATGGDIFVHAKCNLTSKLFELAQLIIRNLPAGSIDRAEDIYGFVYKNGRDLSGFIDGTENAADEESRQVIAVEKQTGGSYVITQKWLHDFNIINNEKEKNMEAWLGRSRPDSTEIYRKSISSHVARMTGGSNFEQKKVHEILRQSQPFGVVSGDAGLFFIAYSADPERFDWMLDRMVGAGGDGHSDDVMRLSKCVASTYWYFPGVGELNKLK